MANRRVVLQPITEVESDQVLDSCCVVTAADAKSALFWVNVRKNKNENEVSVILEGASSLSLGASPGGTGSSWCVLGTVDIPASTLGAFKAEAANVPDFLRWQVRNLSASIQFEVILYLNET